VFVCACACACELCVSECVYVFTSVYKSDYVSICACISICMYCRKDKMRPHLEYVIQALSSFP
jgi:hypothetical protein